MSAAASAPQHRLQNIVGGIAGCIYLFLSLPVTTQLFFVGAQAIGLLLYIIYGSGAAQRARTRAEAAPGG